MMRVPQRFVGLHAHTGFSVYDGLGYPDEHFTWCMENGLDAHAVTDHGNMNAFAHAYLWTYEWNKNNPDKRFKFIPGVEAYFHPSLAEWHALKSSKEEHDEGQNAGNQLVLEKEEETKKSVSALNPLNRRHHLVLLAKNSVGLQKIFAAVSRSYLRGFYRYPRMDPDILNEVGVKGDVIASTACIGGPIAFELFSAFSSVAWSDISQSLLDDASSLDVAVAAVERAYAVLEPVFGRDDLYLELQFNKLPQQHFVNRAILEFASRKGLRDKLIVTCDSHYPRPEQWRDREIYKKLGYLNYESYGPESIPKSRDELKCELYPKNAAQLWETFLTTTDGMAWYDRDIVIDAIERTHEIAHVLIGDVQPDKSIKLPKKLIPPGKTSTQHLVSLCKDGMKRRGLAEKPEYVARLREELEVIKHLKVEEYFIALHRMIQLAREVTLVGPGRGSGGGSLVNYVLYNTELDPIKWNLPFSRFLSVYRVGMADVDCVHENHLVVMADGAYKRAGDIVVGDSVLGGDNTPHAVTMSYSRGLRTGEDAISVRVATDEGVLGLIVAVPMHKFLKEDGTIVRCRDVAVGDRLMSTCGVSVVSIEHAGCGSSSGSYVDITVEDDCRFHIVPFDVFVTDDGTVSCSLSYTSST